MEPSENISSNNHVPIDKLTKYWDALDIITPSSNQSCCFTKAYFHYLTGSGSILDFTDPPFKSSENHTVRQTQGKFRYFTPREVSRLLCYPEEFQFPSHHSLKQKYKALGNSVNVFTVAMIFSLLFSN